jgi:hypothetical protein
MALFAPEEIKGIEEEDKESTGNTIPATNTLFSRSEIAGISQAEAPAGDAIRAMDVNRMNIKQKTANQIKGLIPDNTERTAKNLTDITPIPGVKDPSEYAHVTMPDAEAPITGGDLVNFMVGPEMSVVGMKLDNEGLTWDWENMKTQWSEEPLWLNLMSTTSLVGSILFPAAKAAHVSVKYGSMGMKMPGLRDQASKAAGLFGGGKWVPLLDKKEEINKFKTLGLLDKSVNDITDDKLRMLRQMEYNRSKFIDTAERIAKADAGEIKVSPMEALKHAFVRRFSNQYMKIANLTEGADVRRQYHDSLDNLWKSEDIGRFFVDIPEAAAGPRIYQHYLWKSEPATFAKPKLSESEARWANYLGDAMVEHQDEMLEAGVITQETYDRIGQMHVPALLKSTPQAQLDATRTYMIPVRGRKATGSKGPITTKPVKRKGLLRESVEEVFEEGEGVQHIALKTFKFPRLDGPTLMPRGSTRSEIYERLMEGQLITDPVDLTVHGFVTDRLLLHNFKFVRDVANNTSYSVPAADMVSKYTPKKGGPFNKAAAEAAGYMPLDSLGGQIPNTVRRMLEKVNSNMLGPNGELPWIRRELFEQMFDENGIFGQVQAATNFLDMTTAIHKTAKTALNPPTHFQNAAGNGVFLMQGGFNIVDPSNINLQSRMAKTFNKIAGAHRFARDSGRSSRDILDNMDINLGKIKVNGKTFDLNEELLNPQVRELIEESAFNAVEGYQALEDMYSRLRKDQYLTRQVAEGFLGFKKMAQLGDKKGFRWFDNMTKWYLAEDMVPKMSYYMKLRGDGFSRDAAIIEVGRRLPMYSTVGSTVKSGRRFLFPWLTFPTEALRIQKNNIMDYPIRMMPWLRLPQIMQTAFAGAGGLGGPENVEESKLGLSPFAHQPTTVMATGRQAGTVGGVLGGGIIGGVAGALKGGARGAAVGAAAGAAGTTAIAQSLMTDDKGDQIRGMVLDWLPHSSFMIASTSPFMGDETYPWKSFAELQQQLPAEPLAILKPIIELAEGKTAFGAPVRGETFGDKMSAAMAGFIGFVAPPWIQRYGLKSTTPDISIMEYLETQAGVNIPGAGLDPTNVSTLLMDTGTFVDPNTGKAGSLSHDFFLKNIGMAKSWGSDPTTRLINESRTEQHLTEIRSTMSRNLAMYLANGTDDLSNQVLYKVMATFTRQYANDPVMAQRKYREWLERRLDAIGRHPRLRNWSQEELKARLIKASEFAEGERGRAREDLLKTLRNELMVRKLSQ